MSLPADKFTRYKQTASAGKRFNVQSPILSAYEASQNTTMGVVTEFTDMGESLDRCVVLFRGRLIRATCCHPDISVGMNVALIEQPIGIWWATVLQKSWYSRPLSELIEKGRPYQAALEYILSFGPKWRPTLIIIDKRGQQIDPPEPPPEPPTPPIGWPDYVAIDVTSPGFVVGYTRENWPYDPALFDIADLNGDGFVDETELLAFLAEYGTPALYYGGGGGLLRTDFFVGPGDAMYVRFTLPRVVANMYSRPVAWEPFIEYTSGRISNTLEIYRKSDGGFIGSFAFTGGSDPVVWVATTSVAALQDPTRVSGWKISIPPTSGTGWSPPTYVYTLT